LKQASLLGCFFFCLFVTIASHNRQRTNEERKKCKTINKYKEKKKNKQCLTVFF